MHMRVNQKFGAGTGDTLVSCACRHCRSTNLAGAELRKVTQMKLFVSFSEIPNVHRQMHQSFIKTYGKRFLSWVKNCSGKKLRLSPCFTAIDPSLSMVPSLHDNTARKKDQNFLSLFHHFQVQNPVIFASLGVFCQCTNCAQNSY